MMPITKFAVLAVLLRLASSVRSLGTPVDSVVDLITDLKKKIESDGKDELKSYDKYACWCEETLATKASDITTGKASIEDLETEIKKLMGELAVHSEDIKQLKKDVAQNEESQKEAKQVREKEYEEYDEEKTEGEQCIGALEAAIGVLTGAGEKGFLQKTLSGLQQAQLLSTVGALRGVLSMPLVHQKVSKEDLEAVREFVYSPDDYLSKQHGHSDAFSAAQTGKNNPFGDYAPQSGAIQGILKGMYDAFTSDLEKSNAHEANKRKAYEELMETKKLEEKTLKATLGKQESTSADKTKDLADSRTKLEDTKDQLAADEEFFAKTKTSCKDKASAWAERTRLRTEELHGIAKAIEILDSDEAKETFKGATTTFLQVAAEPKKAAAQERKAAVAFSKLRTLYQKFGGLSLAEVAAQAKMGGHFDKLIHMIENMIIKLKEEGEADIKHRDLCEAKQTKNKQALEDHEFDLDKQKEALERMRTAAKELKEKIKKLEGDIKASNKEIKEMKDMRAKEFDEFSEAKKDDLAAIELLSQAIDSLSKFYSENNKLLLAQKKKQAREDPPETWDEEYGGQKQAHTGIIAILSMIKEDLEKEVENGTKGNDAATANYASDLSALQETLDAQEASKADADVDLAGLERTIEHEDSDKEDIETDLKGEKKVKKAIEEDCDWIETDFKDRATKRAAEIQGLIEAKTFLGGAVMID